MNHERVETTPLRHLDEVQVGRFVLLFMLGGVEEHVSLNLSRSLSHDPSHLSIGEVLNILREEFPRTSRSPDLLPGEPGAHSNTLLSQYIHKKKKKKKTPNYLLSC